MNADKIIHEARGLCCHTTTITYYQSDKNVTYEINCQCGMLSRGAEPSDFLARRVAVFNAKKYEDIPNYTDPIHYCALMDWMRKDDRLNYFEEWRCRKGAPSMYTGFYLEWMHSSRQEQVTLIAEAIEAGVLP